MATQKPASVRQGLVCGRHAAAGVEATGRGVAGANSRAEGHEWDHQRAPGHVALFLVAQAAQMPAAAPRRVASLAHDRDGVANGVVSCSQSQAAGLEDGGATG